VFTAKADPVQDAVLENWGISVLHQAATDPAESMLLFLSNLKAEVCGIVPNNQRDPSLGPISALQA
jgi:hypothetical protein